MIIVKIIGGLGNQLFQYSTGRALSLRINTQLKLDLSFYDNAKYRKVFRLDKFNLPYVVAKESDYNSLKNPSNIPQIYSFLKRFGIKVRPYYKPTHIHETELLKLLKLKKKACDYYIDGWLSNQIYFKEYRDIILNDLNTEHLLNTENAAIYQEVKSINSVAVHIRRKDYLTNTYFVSLPVEYYEKAMNKAIEDISNPVFFFFSDDITWVKEQFSKIPNVRYIENNSFSDTSWSTTGDIADLMLMRSCKHQIIANSTFSWWGAWLNENPLKKVYYPALWYNNKNAQKQFESNKFMPSDWIKVKF